MTPIDKAIDALERCVGQLTGGLDGYWCAEIDPVARAKEALEALRGMQSVDVEAFKKPIPYDADTEKNYTNCALGNEKVRGYNQALDDLAARGYLRTALPEIEGLELCLERQKCLAEKYRAPKEILKAATAYHQLQGDK